MACLVVPLHSCSPQTFIWILSGNELAVSFHTEADFKKRYLRYNFNVT